MPAGRFKPVYNQKPVVAKPKFKAGKQAAAGGAVLRRQTFQPENRKQQAGLARDIKQGQQVRQQQVHKPASVTIGALLSKQNRQTDVAAQRYHAAHPRKSSWSVAGVAHNLLRKGERVPGVGPAVGFVDPWLIGQTIKDAPGVALKNVERVIHPPKIREMSRAEALRVVNNPKTQPTLGIFQGGRIGKAEPTEGIAPKSAIPTEDVAAGKVAGALGSARARRAAQEGLYREERGKRIAAARSASERAGGGEAGFAAAKEQLRGELPKVQFHNLREGKLGQNEFESLLTQVQNHHDLNYWEKIHAQQGLVDAFREGKTPQRSQIKHFQTVFGQDAANEIMKTSKLVKAGKVAMNTLNIPRSMMASFDLSAPFRQGLVAGVSHPGVFFKNFKPMIKAAGSENFYKAMTEEIERRPNIDLYHESGLKLTDLSKELGHREEAFPSEYAETLTGGKRGPVRASGRAYTGFLNKMRADMFDKLLEKGRKKGWNVEDRKFQRGLASYVNSATGRGSLGPAEPWGPALNTFFFSPRLMASRINFLNPLWYAKLPPGVRGQALKSAVKLGAFGGAAGLAGAAAGGRIGTDPRSSDFGKIKFGNTRLDPLGGFSQYLVAGSRIASGKSISSVTGEVSRLGPGMGQLSRKDIAERFFAGKATPAVSAIYDILQGKDFQGQPLDVKTEILNRVIPLAIQDAYSLYADKKNIPLGIAGYAGSGLGLGIQTYGPRQIAKNVESQGKQLPKELMSAAKKAGLGNVAITPEMKREIKVLTDRQVAYGQVRQSKGHLTPADRFVADVNLLVKNGIGSSQQAKEAAQWAKTAKPSELKSARSRLTRQYFSHPNLSYAVKVLKDHGQTVKLPRGG